MGIDFSLQAFDQEAYDVKVFLPVALAVHGGDNGPLTALLRTLARDLPKARRKARRPVRDDPRAELDEALAIVEGRSRRKGALPRPGGVEAPREVAVREYVKQFVAGLVIDLTCVVRVGVEVLELDLWNSELSGYLFEGSAWIAAQFRGNTPRTDGHFEFSRRAGTSTLPPWFADRFRRELARVPRPDGADPWLQGEYDRLAAILDAVGTNTSLRLVLEAS
jgi:hypothetical protein